MHEIGIAAEILKIVVATAQEAGMKDVTRIKVVVGSERMVVASSLLFAFAFIKSDTCAHSAVLEIESTVGRELFIDYMEGE